MENFTEAAARLDQGTLYDFSYPYVFRWSPVAAWVLGLITLMPLWAWQVLHVAFLPPIGPGGWRWGASSASRCGSISRPATS